MIELIEFFWDEQTGISHYTYENSYTGEISQQGTPQPLAKPEATDELRDKYFAELVTYLKTQDPYGPEERY